MQDRQMEEHRWKDKFEHLRKVCVKNEDEVQQILGKALGYPWFKDDLINFPNATEADGVCVGDHVSITLAMEIADKLRVLQENLKRVIEAKMCGKS